MLYFYGRKRHQWEFYDGTTQHSGGKKAQKSRFNSRIKASKRSPR